MSGKTGAGRKCGSGLFLPPFRHHLRHLYDACLALFAGTLLPLLAWRLARISAPFSFSACSASGIPARFYLRLLPGAGLAWGVARSAPTSCGCGMALAGCFWRLRRDFFPLLPPSLLHYAVGSCRRQGGGKMVSLLTSPSSCSPAFLRKDFTAGRQLPSTASKFCTC